MLRNPLLREEGGAAEKRRIRVGHDKCRYCLEIGLKTAFSLEAFAKRQVDKDVTEFGTMPPPI